MLVSKRFISPLIPYINSVRLDWTHALAVNEKALEQRGQPRFQEYDRRMRRRGKIGVIRTGNFGLCRRLLTVPKQRGIRCGVLEHSKHTAFIQST